MVDALDGRNGQVFIASAARTPIGKFGGALAETPATELGGVAIRAAVERSGLPEGTAVDEVLMGQVLQAGVGQAPARQAALAAGLPARAATTINRVCGSGLKSIMLAAAEIRAGDAEIVVAGGMENMNQAPVPPPQGALRLPPGRCRAHRRDRPRRPVVRTRGVPHGHPRRARRDQEPRLPPRPGPVRAGEPPEGARRDQRRPLQRRDRRRSPSRCQGPRDGRRRTRAQEPTRASRRWPD